MKIASPVQAENVVRSFAIILGGLTLLWALASLAAFGDILVGRPILLLNLGLAAALAWPFYRARYHQTLSYDEEGFTLTRGRAAVSGRWEEFGSVSLFHPGRGGFAVRLYRSSSGEGEFVEIPASRLRLDPSAFRFEVMRLVSEAAARAGERPPGGGGFTRLRGAKGFRSGAGGPRPPPPPASARRSLRKWTASRRERGPTAAPPSSRS